MSVEKEKTNAETPTDATKREVLAKLGKYAAYTAPVMLMTLGASGRKAEAQSGGVENCFIGTTLVLMADKTTRPISEVEIGDEVIGENGKIHRVIDREIHLLGGRKLYSINGGPAFVTPEHPFMTRGGWKSMNPIATLAETKTFLVGTLRLGDELVQLVSVGREMELMAVGAVSTKALPAVELMIETTFSEIKSIASSDDDPMLSVYNLRLDGSKTYFANSYLVHTK